MNFKGLTKVSKTIGAGIAKNSPTILTGISVAGLVATTIMGVTATPKAIRLIEEMKCRKIDELESDKTGIELEKMDYVKAAWKCYVPTAIMGAVTMGCIIGANSINLRRNAALAGLYSLSETALKEYQAKVVEKIGETKAKEIKDEIVQDKLKRVSVNSQEIIITGRGDTLCYDSMSGRLFWSSKEAIETGLNRLSRRLMSDMFISLNEVYSELNLEGNKLGDLVGWHIDFGLIEPEFSTQLSEDGRPCLVLDFDVAPRYLDRDF